MRNKIIAYFLVVMMLTMSGCFISIPKEAHTTKALGDREVAKMRVIAERNIRARYDASMAQVWLGWEEAVKKAEAIEPVGMVPASFMIRITKLRDQKLNEISRNRSLELQQLRDLHANAIATSNGLIDAWAEQSKISSEMVKQTRAFALEVGEMYVEHRRQKSLQEAAEEAARREAEAEHHGE